MEEVKVVKIFTSQDNLQAEMILDTLKQNGIPAYKKDADESGFMNIYGGQFHVRGRDLCGGNGCGKGNADITGNGIGVIAGWSLWNCWKEDVPTGVFTRKKSVKKLQGRFSVRQGFLQAPPINSL